MHPVKLLLEQVAALGHVLLAPLALEPLADPLFGRGALDKAQPVPARAVRALGRQDLDDLSVLQRVVQGHHAAVDLGSDAAVADLGVDPVSEVDRGRIRRKIDHVPPRREDVDLVLEQVDLDGVEKRLRVADLVLPLQKAAQP